MPEILLSPNRDDLVAIVDDEDFQFLVRWRWSYKQSSKRWKRAIYARRAVAVYENGQRVKTISIYLHHVVLERAGKKRPSSLHTADHINRNPLDNRRENLRWATKRTQTRNRTPRAAVSADVHA